MKQEVVTVVLDALRAAFGSQLKAFYDGDPDVIPDFNLPAAVVSKLSDETVHATSAEDDVAERIIVKVILDKRQDWTTQDDTTDLTERRIRRLVEARDPETSRFLPNTVKHVVRQAIDANGWLVVGPLTFELGSLQRTQELVTMEGHVTFTVTYSVMVN